nr:hypothetical protein [Alphaproteobacteria bacterium]
AILTYVVLLPIKNINATENEAIIKKTQTLFDRLLKDMTNYGRSLNHEIDIPEAILTLETLIAQGANPNKKIPYSGEGEGDAFLYTPISYIFFTCGNDFRTYDSDGRNFYLDIIKLLIDSGVNWHDKNDYETYDGDTGTTTIAYELEWVEEAKHRTHCIEALDYVKNHLKENNITLAE